MSIYIIRHGYRLSYEDIKAYNDHPRTKENPADEPLGPKGHSDSIKTAQNLIKVADFDDKPLILYCSPMTRCVETAVHIIDELRENLKIPIKICIDYSLAERIYPAATFEYNRGKIHQNLHDYAIWDGIKFKTPIDRLLKLKALNQRFPGYIDMSYKSPVVQQYLANTEGDMEMIISWFKDMKFKPDINVIIVTHLVNLWGLYTFLKPNQKLSWEEAEPIAGRSGTNTTLGYNIKSKKIIYGPTNDFLKYALFQEIIRV